MSGLIDDIGNVGHAIEQGAEELAGHIADLGLEGLEWVLQDLGIHDTASLRLLKAAIDELGTDLGRLRDAVVHFHDEGIHYIIRLFASTIVPHFANPIQDVHQSLSTDQSDHDRLMQECLSILTSLQSDTGSYSTKTIRTDRVFAMIEPLSSLRLSINSTTEIALNASATTVGHLNDTTWLAIDMGVGALAGIILAAGIVLAPETAFSSLAIAMGLVAGLVGGALVGALLYFVVKELVLLVEALGQAIPALQHAIHQWETQFATLIATIEAEAIKLAIQLTAGQQKVANDAETEIKNRGLSLPKAIIELLAYLGFTVDQIVEIAKVWDWIQRGLQGAIEAFFGRLLKLQVQYPNVPTKDIICLMIMGYTDDDINRILPYYGNLQPGLEQEFDKCLGPDSFKRKGSSRVIATIIAIGGNNVKAVGSDIGVTDLDLVLNNNGVVQIGGVERKSNPQAFSQFIKSYQYAKAHGSDDAYIYVEVGNKTGRKGNQFQNIIKDVTRYMTSEYKAQGYPDAVAQKMAEDYAYKHVQPIGYKIGMPWLGEQHDYPYGTLDLAGNVYPPGAKPPPE